MRVLYLSLDYTPHDHRFLEALAQSPHEVHYLRLQDDGRELESRSLPGGVQPLAGWDLRQSMTWAAAPPLVSFLKEALPRLAPEIVHAGPIQLGAAMVAAAGFHPLVSMSWGSDLLRGARRGWGRWTAAYALRRTDVLACDCRAVKRRAVELGMAADRIAVFPWGVDLEHFSPGPSARLRGELGWEQALVMLSTRALEKVYGLDLLVRAFIQAAGLVPDLRWLLLGGGALEGHIRQALDQAELTDRVSFQGQVGFDDLPEIYRSADIYVSASRSDGSSISLLEAMACGLPSLVSDIPGNREWIAPEETGWWFKDGDGSSLFRSLVEAADHRQRFKELGRRARRIAEARANWQENFALLLGAYERARLMARPNS